MKDHAIQLAPALTPARSQPPTVIDLISAMIDRGITKDNAESLAALVKLKNDEEDRTAKKDFQDAFLSLQKRLQHFKAVKEVRTKEGVLKYRTMDFDELDEQIRPLALEYGFTYDFTEAPARDRKIGKVCIIAGFGHEKRNEFYVRDSGLLPKADGTDPKNDLMLHGFAKRGALCDAFNIVIDRSGDDDKNDGAPITQEQADSLRRRVMDTGTFEPSFLKYAGAKTFEEIGAMRYAELDELLKKKESTK